MVSTITGRPVQGVRALNLVEQRKRNSGPPLGPDLKPRRRHGSNAIKELKHSDGE